VILYDVKRLIQKQVLINLLLGRLALSHLRIIRFPFRRLLRLARITVEVFLPASTRGVIKWVKVLKQQNVTSLVDTYRHYKSELYVDISQPLTLIESHCYNSRHNVLFVKCNVAAPGKRTSLPSSPTNGNVPHPSPVLAHGWNFPVGDFDTHSPTETSLFSKRGGLCSLLRLDKRICPASQTANEITKLRGFLRSTSHSW
jgi:hypothetical protein